MEVSLRNSRTETTTKVPTAIRMTNLHFYCKILQSILVFANLYFLKFEGNKARNHKNTNTWGLENI
eukprot:1099313-Amphidinium_carterae.1